MSIIGVAVRNIHKEWFQVPDLNPHRTAYPITTPYYLDLIFKGRRTTLHTKDIVSTESKIDVLPVLIKKIRWGMDYSADCLMILRVRF